MKTHPLMKTLNHALSRATASNGRLGRVIITLLLLTACSAGAAEVSQSNGQPELACDLPAEWDGGADLIIFLLPDLAGSAIADFEVELTASATIDRLRYIDQAEALRNFRETFKDSALISGSVSLDDMPSSFRIAVRDHSLDATDELIASYQDDGRVFEAIKRPRVCPPTDEEVQALCEARPHESMVFLNPNEEQSAIDRIGDRLAASPDVDTLTFVDKAEAYEEFLEDFASQSASVSENDMPPSFRITANAAAIAPLLDSLRSDPAIFEVVESGC